MGFEVTPAHQAIFDFITNESGNLIIEAVAGAGKTTTIVEAVKLIPSTRRVIFLAFNAKIATELSNRLPRHAPAATLNALGWRAWKAHAQKTSLPSPRLEKDKTSDLLDEMLPEWAAKRFGGTIGKLVRLGKSSGIIPSTVTTPGTSLLPDTDQTWTQIVSHYGVDLEPEEFSEVIGFTRQILAAGLEKTDTLDFDDQLYMTHAWAAPVPAHDFVIVDEAQDLSPLQHELVARALGKNGRLIAVGDPCQAIYGFRGADSDSMGVLARKFTCAALPLHVSYRCPQAVVRVAQRFVAHIQPHHTAPEGTVVMDPVLVERAPLERGDMVVCRFTAPLIRSCYTLIRRNIPAVVLGRDIGKGLTALIRKLRPTSISDLETRLEKWLRKEIEKNINKEEKIAAAEDKADTIRVFMDFSKTLPELNANIEQMFADTASDNVVTLCSIHKSKGLESERVFILNFRDMPCKWARQPWQAKQEINLCYVAVTRAKSHLQMIDLPR